MAKKNWLKAVVGIGAVAVAGKVAYDKYKSVKEVYTQEENDSIDDEIKKYNAICQKKMVEVEDEEFTGCEIKTTLSSTVIDLGLATFEKDVYINFTSMMSGLTIILPEGVNVACDINKTLSGVRNLVDNVDEEGISTVYVIGKATCSSIEIVPINFYVDDEDIEGLEDDDFMDDDDFVDESEVFIIKSDSKVESVVEKAKEVVEEKAEKAAGKVRELFGKGKKAAEETDTETIEVVEEVLEDAVEEVTE